MVSTTVQKLLLLLTEYSDNCISCCQVLVTEKNASGILFVHVMNALNFVGTDIYVQGV